MKLLLTSYGITNNTIANTLTELIGKQPNESKIAFVPTANNTKRGDNGWMIDHMNQFRRLGYAIDIVELTALQSDVIKSAFENVDAIVIGGGNCFYLSYIMQQKGLFEFLPSLLESKVYVGISVGSMIVGQNFRLSSQALAREENISEEDYNNLGPNGETSARTFGIVDITVKPHLNSSESAALRTEEMSLASHIGPSAQFTR